MGIPTPTANAGTAEDGDARSIAGARSPPHPEPRNDAAPRGPDRAATPATTPE